MALPYPVSIPFAHCAPLPVTCCTLCISMQHCWVSSQGARALGQRVLADGALVVTTPQDVAIIDVRKEISFCHKTSLPVLGVVENMAGLQLPMSRLQFKAADGTDVTEAVQHHLPSELQQAVACCDVFAASKGGAQAMAKHFSVPYLGSVPLDPALSRVAEEGRSLQELKESTSLPAFNAIVDRLCAACHMQAELT